MKKTPPISSVVPEELQPFTDEALFWARGLLEKGEKVPSVYFVGSISKGVIAVVPVDTSSDEGKAASLHQARTIAAAESADFSIMLSEAWSLSPKDNLRHAEIRRKYGNLANYPGHVDVLTLQLETHFGFFGLTLPILPKPPSKKRRTLGSGQWIKADYVEGNLAGVLAGVGGDRTVH